MGLQRIVDTNGNPTWFVSYSAAELLALITQFQQQPDLLQQLQADAAGTAPGTSSNGNTASPPATTPNTRFGGIIVFSGDNSATLATNPAVVGKHLNYPASLIVPVEGQYNFAQIDKDMRPWVDEGKQIQLRISWSGWGGWVSPKVLSWTPDWVYAKGVKSTTASDGSKKPEYWNPTYLSALSDFATALAQKYDGNPNILGIVIAVGDGSETKVDTKNDTNRLKRWQAIGYTDQLWLDTIKKIITIYHGAFTKTPLILLPNASFIGGTKGLSESNVTDFAMSLTPPVWLQEDGIVPGKTVNSSWSKTTILAEQRAAAASAKELDQDFQAALSAKAKYMLIFSSNFTSAYQPTLDKYAALAKS